MRVGAYAGKETDVMTTWTWPQGQAIVLYHWSWFDPAIGDVIVGWSQQREADSAGYVHLEAEQTRPQATVKVFEDGDVLIEPHTFTILTPLPLALHASDGQPLPWVQALASATTTHSIHFSSRSTTPNFSP